MRFFKYYLILFTVLIHSDAFSGTTIPITAHNCPRTFSVNGCSLDQRLINIGQTKLLYNPSSICNLHDKCFRSLGAGKEYCDIMFGAKLRSKCKSVHCPKVAGRRICALNPTTYQLCLAGANIAEGIVKAGPISKYNAKQEERIRMLSKCGRDRYLAPKSEFEDDSFWTLVDQLKQEGESIETSLWLNSPYTGTGYKEKITANLRYGTTPKAGNYTLPPSYCPTNY